MWFFMFQGGLGRNGPYKIFTVFNISILMNGSKMPNTMPKSSHLSTIYVLRDIKKDEEILTDYNIFTEAFGDLG